MDEPKARRTRIELTEEQRARLEAARREAQLELPELLAQEPRLEAAASEPTISGRLRQAIHAAPVPLPVLASRAGVGTARLGDFLRGEEGLSSGEIDKLATLLGCELVQTR